MSYLVRLAFAVFALVVGAIAAFDPPARPAAAIWIVVGICIFPTRKDR